MTTDQWITLSASGLAIAASAIAASVSVYNARFRRFARERWWERQVETYSQIIDALSGLVRYHEAHYDAAVEQRTLSEKQREEIDKYWRDGYAELKRATNVGAFLISKEAEKALQAMWHDHDKGVDPHDWFGQIESNYSAAEKCLGSIVIAAKKDLGVE